MVLMGGVTENVLGGSPSNVVPYLLSGGIDINVPIGGGGYPPAQIPQVPVIVNVPPAQQAPPQTTEFTYEKFRKPEFAPPIPYKPYNDILQRYPQATAQALDNSDFMPNVERTVSDAADFAIPRNAGSPQPEQGYARPLNAQPANVYGGPSAYGGNVQGNGMQQQPQGNPYADIVNNLPANVSTPQLEAARANQNMMNQYLGQAVMQGPQYVPNLRGPDQMTGMQRFFWSNPGMNKMYNAQQVGINQQNAIRQREHAAKLSALTQMIDNQLSNESSNAREVFQQGWMTAREVIKMAHDQRQGIQKTVNELGKQLLDMAPEPGEARDKLMAGMIRSMAESGAPMEAINAFRQYRTAPNPKGMAMQDNRELKGERDTIKLQVEKATLGDKIASSHERRKRLEQTNPAAIALANSRAAIAALDEQIKRSYGDETARVNLERKKQILAEGNGEMQNKALSTARTVVSQYQQKEGILNNTFDPARKAQIKKDLQTMRGDYEDALEIQRQLGQQRTASAGVGFDKSNKVIPQAAYDFYKNNPQKMPKAALDKAWKEQYGTEPPGSPAPKGEEPELGLHTVAGGTRSANSKQDKSSAAVAYSDGSQTQAQFYKGAKVGKAGGVDGVLKQPPTSKPDMDDYTEWVKSSGPVELQRGYPGKGKWKADGMGGK